MSTTSITLGLDQGLSCLCFITLLPRILTISMVLEFVVISSQKQGCPYYQAYHQMVPWTLVNFIINPISVLTTLMGIKVFISCSNTMLNLCVDATSTIVGFLHIFISMNSLHVDFNNDMVAKVIIQLVGLVARVPHTFQRLINLCSFIFNK